MLQQLIRSGAMAVLCAFSFLALAADNDPGRLAGVARIDITPDYPVRLAGYAVRKQESEGVAQRLWAKALALGSDKEGPAILITVDNCGVPASVRDEVVRRLKGKRGRRRLCATAKQLGLEFSRGGASTHKRVQASVQELQL